MAHRFVYRIAGALIVGALLLLAATPRPSGPVFVDSVSLNTSASGLILTRNATTGALTLPSTPAPAISLSLYVNGVRQTAGIDYTLAGTVATPVAAKVTEFVAATEITADYRQ